MSSTRHRIISFILMLSFLTSLTVVPSILAIEIEEDTYERVAGTGLFDLKSLSAPASIYTTQTQTSPLDANLSNVTCMAFLLEDETGVTGTFFQDDVELTTAAIYVPDDYPTIQEAVNAASDGDTIIVRDGTYTENVVVDKRLTIQSENGAENCIVVGQPDHPGDCVFAVTADYVNISGFTVKVEETVVHLYVTAISLDNVDYCNIINNNCPTCNIDLDSSNNNILNNNTVSNTWIGISLYDSSSNTLTNNNCSNNTNDGIHLYESNNNILINNMIVSKGIDVYDSYQNIVENNTVNGKPLVYLEDETDCRIAYAGQVVLVNCDNITVENLNLSNVSVGVDLWGTDNSKLMNITTQGNDYGIYLYESNNNSVSSNNCLNNEDGIYLLNSDSNLLFSNNCSNNSGDGIYLGLSNNNLLINNMFENDGVEIDYSYQNVVENNTVNGKPLVYLEDETDCRIADAGQVILVNCDNITVENQNLSNASVGLELFHTDNSKLMNITTHGNIYGILCYHSNNNNISNNNCSNNFIGIYLCEYNNKNTISSNNCSNNRYYGIGISSESNSNIVTDNNCSNNFIGIHLCWDSNNNLISNNNCSNNEVYGIGLDKSNGNIISNNNCLNNQEGISLDESNGNIISNNNCSNNDRGIELLESLNNCIRQNNATSNSYGIYIGCGESYNNFIYHNNLVGNYKQAYDCRCTNLWNSSYPTGGNYWDDYLGSDVYSGPDQNVPGSDDFGDTPYIISGDASAQDRYPFMNKDGWLTKLVFGVELSASADALSTAPSENATYLLTIRNTGAVADTYTVSLENADNADVAALSTYYIKNLAAGASTTVLLNVTDAMANSYRASVKATSEGDFTKSATIDTTTTVRDVPRLPSIITISVTPNRTKCGESITISGNIIPASSAIITLTFTTPTGSVLEQTTASPSSGTYRLVFPTNKEGVWFVNATWAGDINYLGDTSKTVSFTVNGPPDVGYAIIITGRHDDNRAQSSIDLTANKVYRILSEERGFTNKSIFYLNPLMEHDANDDEVYDVDRISSLRNVSYAINTWATKNIIWAKYNGSVDVPLLLYMVDHGGTDAFLVNGANHTLTASDLNNYLDQLTDATGCHNITVVIDACMCGSFIDDLSCTGRIIVTSTGIDADAFINKKGAHFSLDFFRRISNGKTIKEAFEDASNNLYLKKYFPEITPMLDDNGDAASKYIGIQGSTLNFPPTIIGAIPSQEVVVNTNITIWAVVVDDSPIEDVYANIIEPNWSPSPAKGTRFEINLTTLRLDDEDGDCNYTARFTPAVLGNYTVILHATDERGYQASAKQLIITAVSPPESADKVQQHTLKHGSQQRKA